MSCIGTGHDRLVVDEYRLLPNADRQTFSVVVYGHATVGRRHVGRWRQLILPDGSRG